MPAKDGDFVKVEYVGKLDDGTVFDDSKKHGEPLGFVLGTGQLIKGFDDAVRGMEVDDLSSAYKKRYSIKEEQGVMITYIVEDSAADKAGFIVGDVITKIENKRVKTKQDFIERTSKIKGSCLVKTNRGYFVLKIEQ